MVVTTNEKRQAAKVVRRLKRDYPIVECALTHRNPFELLIATILSAQCTDKRVNQVTPVLFERFPTAADLAAAPRRSIEKLVQSTGFFRAKAKNIQGCAKALVDRHQGKVPQKIDALVQLPGVGRKTANVVLGTAFGIPSGIVVDTHVGRLSRRLGLTDAKDAVRAERDLIALLPKAEWIQYSHRMIHHGRQICKSRKPDCDRCGMKDICPRIGVGL